MKAQWISLAVLVGAVFFLLPSTFYIVYETDQVVITQFGKPIGGAVTEPGLHWKLPVVQEVNRFDKRFLEWDGDPNELPTRDKRFVFVDTYARWRISDPLLYFQRLRDERGAQTRLDDILDGETRNAIAKHDLVEVVRTTNRTPVQTGDADLDQPLAEISAGRSAIQDEILSNARGRVEDLGIEILDVRLKRINYVKDVRTKVYERMVAERQRIADRYRSEGDGEASRILGEKERELSRIESEAYKKAQEIRGQGDAEATKIYAQAYNASSGRRELYAFLKRLDVLKKSIDGDTKLLLSTQGDVGKLLKSDR